MRQFFARSDLYLDNWEGTNIGDSFITVRDLAEAFPKSDFFEIGALSIWRDFRTVRVPPNCYGTYPACGEV